MDAEGVHVHPTSQSRVTSVWLYVQKKRWLQKNAGGAMSQMRAIAERRLPAMREDHRLVFIDETAVKTNMTRLRGRALKGSECRPQLLLGTDRFLDHSSAMDGECFATYVKTQLTPFSNPAPW